MPNYVEGHFNMVLVARFHSPVLKLTVNARSLDIAFEGRSKGKGGSLV